MLSIALSYEEEDGIVKPDKTMMGAGDKIVWLPDSLCPITRYLFPKKRIGDCRVTSPIYFRVHSGCEFDPMFKKCLQQIGI